MTSLRIVLCFFFILLSLYPITLHLSLAFSIFTPYPLTHFLILSCLFSFLLPVLSPTHLRLISLHSFNSSLTFPLFPNLSLLWITPTVKTSQSASKLELGCLYSERSQVQSAKWKYQNKSRQLRMLSKGPGSISTSLPLPITPNTTGNYTCTLQLKNGQTVTALIAVTLPPEGRRGFTKTRYIISLTQESWQTSCQLARDNEPFIWMILQFFLLCAACCGAFKPTTVNSYVGRPLVYRGESSWQTPYVAFA